MRTAVAAVCLALLAAPAGAEEPHPIVASVKAKLKHPDQPFTMAVVVKVKPGKEKELEAAVAEAARQTRKEKGNVAYDLYRDADHPESYVNWEQWKNLDALAEHVKADYTTKLL